MIEANTDEITLVIPLCCDRTVVWILDEDKDVAHVTAAVGARHSTGDRNQSVGGLRLEEVEVENLVSAALALQTQHDAAVVLGCDTGSAPLPALCTLRTQLVDLTANLHMLARMRPEDTVPCRSGENVEAALEHGMASFFHDLSPSGRSHLEWPFWLQPAAGGESARAMLDRIADVSGGIFTGQQIFRPLFITEPEDLSKALPATQSFCRGGNTFVFDLEALLVPNMLMEQREGLACRRSDFVWAMLNICQGR